MSSYSIRRLVEDQALAMVLARSPALAAIDSFCGFSGEELTVPRLEVVASRATTEVLGDEPTGNYTVKLTLGIVSRLGYGRDNHSNLCGDLELAITGSNAAAEMSRNGLNVFCGGWRPADWTDSASGEELASHCEIEVHCCQMQITIRESSSSESSGSSASSVSSVSSGSSVSSQSTQSSASSASSLSSFSSLSSLNSASSSSPEEDPTLQVMMGEMANPNLGGTYTLSPTQENGHSKWENATVGGVLYYTLGGDWALTSVYPSTDPGYLRTGSGGPIGEYLPTPSSIGLALVFRAE